MNCCVISHAVHLHATSTVDCGAQFSPLCFVVSKTGTEPSSFVLVTKLFLCVAEKFFWFLLFLLLTLDEFTHVGIMSVNVSSNLQIATTVLLTLIPTWNVLSGFYIAKPVSKLASLSGSNKLHLLCCLFVTTMHQRIE